MVNSGIGGQAVIEGIMMRNGASYAVGVRTPDSTIAVEHHPFRSIVSQPGIMKIPLLRGVIAFIDSLVIGIRCLMISASYFDEEPADTAADSRSSLTKEERAEKEAGKAREERLMMTGSVIFSLVFAIAVFMLLPYFLSVLLSRFIDSVFAVSLFEAAVRVLIFIAYLILISRMKDIQRTYMYHGAEHKCINCLEHGLELNVENVMKSSRFHRRCGTSFLVYVILISAVLLMFVQTGSHITRIVIRLLLVPLIAGISYELLRIAGTSDGRLVRVLARPGLAMQKLTTREPDAEMAEVAIAAVEAVFDWKAFLREHFPAGTGEGGST
ncbi:MAG: DUF1385 domain-containing protein [Bilifractor sp.]|jgi:uncharacterized protein YqhQ